MVSRRLVTSFVAVVVAALLLPGVARAQEALRIAIVNPARVFTDMQETKDLKQKMEAEARAIRDEEERRAKDVEEARKRRNLFNPGTAEYNEANKALVEKAIALQTWRQLIQADLQRQQKDQMRTLFLKIEKATKELGEARKFDLVLVDQRADLPADLEQIDVNQLRMLINQRTVLFSSAKLDLTDEVVKKLDAEYKK